MNRMDPGQPRMMPARSPPEGGFGPPERVYGRGGRGRGGGEFDFGGPDGGRGRGRGGGGGRGRERPPFPPGGVDGAPEGKYDSAGELSCFSGCVGVWVGTLLSYVRRKTFAVLPALWGILHLARGHVVAPFNFTR